MHNTLIYDLDLTLIDSLEACAEGANLLAEHFGLEKKSLEQIRIALSLPTEQFWLSLWGKVEPPWSAYFFNDIVPKVSSLIKLYPYTEEILQAGKDKGYLQAIATNRINPWHDLAKLNIAKYFDTAVGSDNVPRPKPEPDMLLTILKQLGVDASRALFVGDSVSDMVCAKNAGLKSLGLLQGGSSQQDLLAAGASVVRENLEAGRDVLNC
ncbi:MAG: HAD family hydrolase [Deltaproteobacteria bacterium]|jgi:phosphoglycolate phosphatase|nr:HAD family hydrolase [Deltaproteobacteria bacterium]